MPLDDLLCGPMDEESARAAYEELRSLLAESGLAWLVAQVDEAIAEGRYIVRRSVRRDRYAEEQIVERAADTRRGEIGTRPFTQRERLQLLLDAAISALAATPRLEEELERNLVEAQPGTTHVEFVNEDTREVTRAVRRQGSVDLPQDRMRDALVALTELRRRVVEDL
jgi:hypothetical protein